MPESPVRVLPQAELEEGARDGLQEAGEEEAEAGGLVAV